MLCRTDATAQCVQRWCCWCHSRRGCSKLFPLQRQWFHTYLHSLSPPSWPMVFSGEVVVKVLKGSRICHLQTCLFGILIISSCRHLKNSKRRERLSLHCPYLPKDRSSKKNPFVINPLPESFITQGGLTLVTGETRSPHHIQTNFVTNHHTFHLIF